MKAIVQDTYGSSEVLRLEEIETPAVGDDCVLVRVRASAVGAAVWHLMSGLPYVVRISGYGLRRPRIRVPGTDVAGIVEAVGKNVTRLSPGDEVFGECEGFVGLFESGVVEVGGELFAGGGVDGTIGLLALGGE